MARRVVVTGGGSGLGRAIARRLAREPVDLVLVGRRAEPLEETAALVLADSPLSTVLTRTADLREPADVESLAHDLRSGPLVDVLVLNAGGTFSTGGPGLAAVADDWTRDFAGNVLPTVLLGEALVDHLSDGSGRVVAMSSVAGLRGAGSYGAAKSAVNNWVWWMALRLAERGITVNAVAPGFVPDTDFWTERLAADPGLHDSRVRGIPMARAGTPEEVAEAVAHLTSADAGWTTGQLLGVNGGVVIGR